MGEHYSDFSLEDDYTNTKQDDGHQYDLCANTSNTRRARAAPPTSFAIMENSSEKPKSNLPWRRIIISVIVSTTFSTILACGFNFAVFNALKPGLINEIIENLNEKPQGTSAGPPGTTAATPGTTTVHVGPPITTTEPLGTTTIADGSCSLPIAYYARRNVDTVVDGGKTVDFKDVETDTCNTYNSTTGTFTCPSDGVYVFHYFALDHADGRATYLQLRKNNVVVAHTWSRGDTYRNKSERYDAHETGANTAIISLVKGDKVYITAAYGRPAKLYHGYTTFSGFKLN